MEADDVRLGVDVFQRYGFSASGADFFEVAMAVVADDFHA